MELSLVLTSISGSTVFERKIGQYFLGYMTHSLRAGEQRHLFAMSSKSLQPSPDFMAIELIYGRHSISSAGHKQACIAPVWTCYV